MASRKHFLGAAHDLTTRFVSRNNDIDGHWGVGVVSLWLHEAGLDTVEYDLLSTAEGDVDSARWLKNWMASTATPDAWLASATLRVVYTARTYPSDEREWPVWVDKPTGVPMYRVVVTAILVDDHRRRREASSVTWCWDFDPRREWQSSRRSQ